MSKANIPTWLIPSAWITLAASILIPLVVLVIILLGFTNPRPIGDLIVLTGADNALTLTNPEPDTIHEMAVPGFEAQGPGTVEITFRQIEGPTDALYGIAWSVHYYGINSNGYAGVWTDAEYFFGLTRYPHVRPSGEANRLRIDFDTATQTIMLNDELVTTLDTGQSGLPEHLTLFVETFDQGGATIAVERVQVWAQN